MPSSRACNITLMARWAAMALISLISGKVALLAKSSSLMSSTRASAEALIIALVTTPVWPRAAPRANPGKINLTKTRLRLDKQFRIYFYRVKQKKNPLFKFSLDHLKWHFNVVHPVQFTFCTINHGNKSSNTVVHRMIQWVQNQTNHLISIEFFVSGHPVKCQIQAVLVCKWLKLFWWLAKSELRTILVDCQFTYSAINQCLNISKA